MSSTPAYKFIDQDAQQLQAQGADATLQIRMINVMKESLARAKAHVRYIEQRIEAHQADSERRQRRSATLQSLIHGEISRGGMERIE